ncbi:serine kinase [Altererythrobacter soli]|uniref:Serine kinase n=1 Tax=Croceibacterium soli TaxID=1739690 RepID=A0A6I4UUW1_9SPHN|nr:HPr kinase/phosphatase C-terminal domain-containing protein [Croceibacterium soli]MXP42712.1 serine kinase [Croceibacterium soli]
MTTLANISCVAIAGRGVLIEGEPGSGKSSLALALIDRGAVLVGDDAVTLESRGGRLWALPPPNIAGLIEIRNVGLASLPTCSAPLAIVIRFDPDAPRYLEQAERTEVCGHSLPLVGLYPESPLLPLRAEFALKLHGLD